MGKLGKGAQNKVEELWKKEIQVGGNSRERLSALLDFCGLAAAVGEAGGAGEKLAVLPRHRAACTARRQPPAAPCGHSGVRAGQVSRSRVLERPKQAVILLAPMGRGPRAAPRWSRLSPSSLLLQAQWRWVSPVCWCKALLEKALTLLLQGRVHIFCWVFCCQYTWPIGILPIRVGVMFNSLGLWTEKLKVGHRVPQLRTGSF